MNTEERPEGRPAAAGITIPQPDAKLGSLVIAAELATRKLMPAHHADAAVRDVVHAVHELVDYTLTAGLVHAWIRSELAA